MTTTNQEIQRIAEAIYQAVSVEKIYLFGSYAYGTPNQDSDYDFFLVLPDDSPRLLETIQIARKSMISLNRKTPVDILADYKSRFDERKKFNSLERKIFNEGIVLYERT